MELSALWRLLLLEFDQKTAKLGQNLCPLYRECPLYGVSILERFHCIMERHGRRKSAIPSAEPISKDEVLPQNVHSSDRQEILPEGTLCEEK